MLNIVVFGPGCARCKETERLLRQVVEQSGLQVDVQKVTDLQAMAKAGVMLTPAVVINGVVKSSGRIPNEAEIREWVAGS